MVRVQAQAYVFAVVMELHCAWANRLRKVQGRESKDSASSSDSRISVLASTTQRFCGGKVRTEMLSVPTVFYHIWIKGGVIGDKSDWASANRSILSVLLQELTSQRHGISKICLRLSSCLFLNGTEWIADDCREGLLSGTIGL